MKALPLMAVLLLAGCGQPPADQAGEEKVDRGEFDSKHLEATCPVQVTAQEGVEVAIRDCTWSVEDAAKMETVIGCTGLGLESSVQQLNSRRSDLHVTHYPAKGTPTTESFTVYAEAGQTKNGACTLNAPLVGAGTYTLDFEPGCWKQSNAVLPGLQSATVKCPYSSQYEVKSRWY